MGVQIRKVGYDWNYFPLVKRSQAVLSDGTSISMVVDANRSGLGAGAGGDGTNVPKIYIYSSADRVTWTLRATVNFPATSSSRTMASIAVDSANNLHIAFRAGDGSIRYVKLTYSAGPTFTVGSQESAISAPAAGVTFQRVDLDVIGTGTSNVAVVAMYYDSNIKATGLVPCVRNTSNAWVRASTTGASPSGKGVLAWTEDVSVAGNRTATAADHCFVVSATRKGATSDMGDMVLVYKVNLTTGVVSSFKTAAAGFANGLGAGYRNYWVFNTAPNEFTVAGSVSAEPWQMMAYRFTWNGTTSTVTNTVPVSISSGRGTMKRTYAWGWNSVAYAGGNKLIFFSRNASVAYDVVATIDSGKVTWQSGYQFWDNRYQWTTGGAIPPFTITSGASSNFNPTSITTQMWFDKVGNNKAFSLQHCSHMLPLAPANILPGPNSVVASSRPLLSANYKYPFNNSQVRMRMEWQFATDAAFTTNVRSVLEPVTDYIIASNTPAPTKAIVTATETVPTTASLPQGVWYVRARTLDELGSYGPFSSATTFTVSHKPVATDLLPETGKVAAYTGTGTMTFSWKFSDPSVDDVQTAYDLVVEDATSGATIASTGKVTSSISQGQLNIPLAAKGIPLRWKVRLWDADDVAGDYSDYRVLMLLDPPAPTVLTPAPGTLTTGIPVVSWSTNLPGDRTQDSYKVTVTRGGVLVYTSNWVKSSDTSFQSPLGILTNNNNYTYTVTVRDNYGLEGSASSQVTTSWILPAGTPSGWKVWNSEYSRKGYVYVSWDASVRDEDFTAWNVYRRKVGDTTWTLMDSLSVAKDFMAFKDYTNASETTYEYVVTQAVNRYGDVVESAITTTQMVTPSTDSYWLLDQLDQEASVPLFLVTQESFTDEYEEEEYTIIGRGRHVDIGDRIGYSGTMTSQLRDKFTTGKPKYNYVFNPAMAYTSLADGTPDRWELVTTGTTGSLLQESVYTDTPPPANQMPYRIEADGLGAAVGDTIRMRQELNGNEIPGALLVPGTPFTLSVWVYQYSPGDNAGRNYGLTVRHMSGAVIHGTVSDTTLTYGASAVETSIPPGVDLPGNPTDQWRRLQVTGVVGAGAVSAGKLRIEVQISGSGAGAAGPAYLIMGGIQLETGSRTQYLDGKQLDGEWDAVPYLSWSLSNGFYTARKQRLALERLKARKTAVYLRNPFGDVWVVVPGNIAITRIPGVGKLEFADAEIPYKEVSF